MDIKKLKEAAEAARKVFTEAEAKVKEATKKKAKNLDELKEAEAKAKTKLAEAEAKVKEADDEGNHDDAGQDKALIAKMLDEYVDSGEALSDGEREAMESIAMEAYQAHKEMGKESKDALTHAGEAMKLARHMAKKEAAAEESRKAAEAAAAKDKEDKDKECGAGEDKDKNKESNRASELEKELAAANKKLLEANGRLAALEVGGKKAELDSHVDKTLKESGQPVAITKRFRETAGEFKSREDFDSKWKIFFEAVRDVRVAPDWSAIAEKSMLRESDDGGTKNEKKLDFSQSAED